MRPRVLVTDFFGGFREVVKAQPLFTPRTYSMPCVILFFWGYDPPWATSLDIPCNIQSIDVPCIPFPRRCSSLRCLCSLPTVVFPPCLRVLSSYKAARPGEQEHSDGENMLVRCRSARDDIPGGGAAVSMSGPSLLPCRHLFLRGDNCS